MIGATRIVVSANGRYRPDPNGDVAVIAPVHDRGGVLDDLLAWHPNQPTRWWFRFGGQPVLGARQLAVAAYFGDAIRLYSTPEQWLLAGGDGAVILRWGIDCRDLFDGIARVECDCPQLQRRFRKALRSWEPTVASVREARHAA